MNDGQKLEKKNKFLEYYRDLPIKKLAAEHVGVDEDTITNWRKADENFSVQINLAKTDWAKAKAKRVRNPEWLLERIMNDHFGEKKALDITSKGEPIPLIPLPGETIDVSSNNSSSEDTESK